MEKVSASGHDILSVGTKNTGKCVILRTGEPGTQSDFQDLLRDSLIRRFIANSWTVYTVNGEGPGPMTGGEGEAPHPKCEFVKIDSVVIMHKGTAPQPIPGQWTLLTAGALVVRHVVHEAFRNINVIGTAALAEGGWWATSGLRGRGKMGELAVTVSRASWPDPDATEYLAEFTNVYYFRADDAGLYQPHKVQTHPNENPATIAGEGQPSERVNCPLPDLATEQRYSTDKCRPPASAAVIREATIDVSPKTISKCIKSAEFTIAGRGLVVNKDDYELGTVPATGFEPAALTNLGTDDYGRVRQAIHVKFTGLQDANQGLDSVPFTVTTQNGVYVAAVSVGGTCPTTPAAKPEAAKITNVTSSDGQIEVTFSPPTSVKVKGYTAKATYKDKNKSDVLQMDGEPDAKKIDIPKCTDGLIYGVSLEVIPTTGKATTVDYANPIKCSTSPAVTAAPSSPPAAPTNVEAKGQPGGKIVVTFEAGAAGSGAAVIKYVAAAAPKTPKKGESSPITITGSTPDNKVAPISLSGCVAATRYAVSVIAAAGSVISDPAIVDSVDCIK